MTNDFTRMAKRVEKLQTYIKTFVDVEIGRVMDRMATTARRNLMANNSVVTGTLASQTRHRNAQTEVVDALPSTGYATHLVRADAPHAPYVEYGTGVYQSGSPTGGGNFRSPSVPPISAIHRWVRQKGIQPRVYDDQFELARNIAETIATYGSRPHPYMRPAWHQHRQGLSRGHRRGVRKALRRM